MKHERITIAKFLAGVLIASSLFTGCSDGPDEDDGDGNPSALVGIWQRTEMNSGEIASQLTIELEDGGTFFLVTANYQTEDCWYVDGTWTADGNTITMVVGTDGAQSVSAYSISGNTLTVVGEGGATMTLTRLNTMVDCRDYEFGAAGQ